MPPRAPRARNFCWTWNNYDDASIAFLSNLCQTDRSELDVAGPGLPVFVGDVPSGTREMDRGHSAEATAGAGGIDQFPNHVSYVCYQREVSSTGTPHLQGYVRFDRQVGYPHAIRVFPGAHVEICKGTEESNIAYCSKLRTSNGAFVEFGVRARPGKRTDIDEFVVAIRDGARGKRLFETHPGEYLKYGGIVDRVSRFYESTRDFKSIVYWVWGATGTGKSRWAHDTYPGAYWKDAGNKWYDGYEPGDPGHSTVVIDDYRRDFCTFSCLLRLFDRYGIRVENKGGSVAFTPTVIVITAPLPPCIMWSGRTAEDLAQLLRRIEHVVYFDGSCINGIENVYGNAYLRAYETAKVRHEEYLASVKNI